jgi:hypothetical protein
MLDEVEIGAPLLPELLPTADVEVGPPVPAVSAQPLHEPRVASTRLGPLAQALAYLGHRLLQQTLTKTWDAETREKWQKLLSELAEKSSATEPKPRVAGTRWVPPAQVAPPALAVHLDQPARLRADNKREDTREVAPNHPAVGNGPKSGP